MATWFKLHDGKTTVIPWSVYSSDMVFLDVRYNFDAAESAAAFIGKPYKVGEVQIIPAVGGIVGKYNGFSAEVNVIGKLGKTAYFTMNQYSLGAGGSPNFIYHWTDLLYPLGKYVQAGFDEQLYWEPGTTGKWDYGPVVKVTLGNGMYFKGWLAASNIGPHSTFVGIGHSWQ